MYPQINSGRKKAWTLEEDEYLKKLVSKYGAQKWTVISENMLGTPPTIQDASASSAGNDGTTISTPT